MESIALAIVLVLLLYTIVVRPWILRMGVSQQEAAAKMPGDGRVADPNLKYTQGVTINAPKEIVWQYLAQVGNKKAGWYNWDFINRLSDKNYFYEGNKSADRVIPELQQLQAGDIVYLTPQLGMEAEIVQPAQTLVLSGKEKGRYLVVWSYSLQELGSDSTRLLVRWASNLNDGWGVKLLNFLLIEPGGAGIQQSKMLKGIKVRAERDYQHRSE